MNREKPLAPARLLVPCFLLLAIHLAGQTPGAPGLPPDSSAIRKDTARDQSDTIIVPYGFGPDLTITAASFRIDSTGDTPDGVRTATLPFTTTWPAFMAQMDKNPRPYTFWVRCRLQNHSAGTLDISIYCGDINYIDGWFIGSGDPPQRMTGGSLRPPISG
ncbi:MAG TPA: hypothetical protein VHC48_23955, partial [Puia sp.]|nr:hypothetical protein [Puia sp.]